MKKKIKYCPFCGGEAKLEFAKGSIAYKDVRGILCYTPPFYTVTCTECASSVGNFESPEMAIKCWNKRIDINNILLGDEDD